MPRRTVQGRWNRFLGIPLSLGSIQNSWEEAGEAVAEPRAELEKQLGGKSDRTELELGAAV